MKQEILEQLYRQYYASALLYALSLCGQRETAEDLVADAFVKAYVSLDESHPAFSYWLLRVVKNLWLDQLRRQRRQPDWEPESTGGTGPDGTPAGASLSAAAQGRYDFDRGCPGSSLGRRNLFRRAASVGTAIL